MDAKSKAEFINSVASGDIVPCPRCGTSNRPENEYCVSCGSALPAANAPKENAQESAAPAFAPVKESETEKRAKAYVEPSNAFAEGLPAWSIEPPQLMVRRH